MRQLLILILFIPVSLVAQKKEWIGTVVDNNNLPVENATIQLIPGNEMMFTNERGQFIFKNSEVYEQIRVTSIGHETVVISIPDLITKNHKIQLTPQLIQLSAVTITASAGEQFRVLSQLDIEKKGINNAQEVLQLVPGLMIGQHAGGGKAEQVFLRGFDLDHGTDILINVDGMPVNMVSHAHGQGYADLHFLVPELIQKVNFKKGTYYADKGNFATTGFVDFSTYKKLPSNFIKMEAGVFNTFRTVGALNILGDKANNKDQSAYIAADYLYSKGYFDYPQNLNRLNVQGHYEGRLNEKNTLSFTASHFKSKWNASGQIPERAVADGSTGFYGAIDPTEGGNTSRSNINAKIITSFAKGNFLTNQFYYTQYNYELFSNFTFFLNDPVNGDQIRQMENRHLLGYNGSYSSHRILGNIRTQTVFGISLRADNTNNSLLSRTIDKQVTAETKKWGDIGEVNSAVYLQTKLDFSPRFDLKAGIRYDHFSHRYKDKLVNNFLQKASAGIISPKIILNYKATPNTQFYLSAGKGFHSNDTRVVVPKNGEEILPAAYGLDLGTVLKPTSSLMINLAAWYLFLEQEFIYVGDEGIVEPGGKSRRVGMDLSLRYQPFSWLFADIDFNYAHARATEEAAGNNFLPLAPRFTSTGGLGVQWENGFSSSIRYRFMGDRPANEDNSLVAKGYFITDANFNYSKQRLNLGISLQNLFNKKWKETQFETESRLKNELMPVSEIHFTPGTPFFAKMSVAYKF